MSAPQAQIRQTALGRDATLGHGGLASGDKHPFVSGVGWVDSKLQEKLSQDEPVGRRERSDQGPKLRLPMPGVLAMANWKTMVGWRDRPVPEPERQAPAAAPAVKGGGTSPGSATSPVASAPKPVPSPQAKPRRSQPVHHSTSLESDPSAGDRTGTMGSPRAENSVPQAVTEPSSPRSRQAAGPTGAAANTPTPSSPVSKAVLQPAAKQPEKPMPEGTQPSPLPSQVFEVSRPDAPVVGARSTSGTQAEKPEPPGGFQRVPLTADVLASMPHFHRAEVRPEHGFEPRELYILQRMIGRFSLEQLVAMRLGMSDEELGDLLGKGAQMGVVTGLPERGGAEPSSGIAQDPELSTPMLPEAEPSLPAPAVEVEVATALEAQLQPEPLQGPEGAVMPAPEPELPATEIDGSAVPTFHRDRYQPEHEFTAQEVYVMQRMIGRFTVDQLVAMRLGLTADELRSLVSRAVDLGVVAFR